MLKVQPPRFNHPNAIATSVRQNSDTARFGIKLPGGPYRDEYLRQASDTEKRFALLKGNIASFFDCNHPDYARPRLVELYDFEKDRPVKAWLQHGSEYSNRPKDQMPEDVDLLIMCHPEALTDEKHRRKHIFPNHKGSIFGYIDDISYNAANDEVLRVYIPQLGTEHEVWIYQTRSMEEKAKQPKPPLKQRSPFVEGGRNDHQKKRYLTEGWLAHKSPFVPPPLPAVQTTAVVPMVW